MWASRCAAGACRDRRRDRSIPRRTRPPRRPLKGGPGELRKIAATLAQQGKRVSLWFQDEARIGQKGRVCHIWWTRGQRPAGRCDRRFTFAYIFAAAKIGSDDAFALVMPEANTGSMQEFLDRFSQTLPKDEVAVMYADQAGWHGSKALRIPDNVMLLALPAYSPELNPVERIWLYLKERYLSHRLHDDYEAIVDAACVAWNKLTAETGRVTSLCSYPWLQKLIAATVKI